MRRRKASGSVVTQGLAGRSPTPELTFSTPPLRRQRLWLTPPLPVSFAATACSLAVGDSELASPLAHPLRSGAVRVEDGRSLAEHAATCLQAQALGKNLTFDKRITLTYQLAMLPASITRAMPWRRSKAAAIALRRPDRQ